MNKYFILLLFLSILFSCSEKSVQNVYFRYNQAGYLPNDPKVVVVLSETKINDLSFSLATSAENGEEFQFQGKFVGVYGSFPYCYRLDFSEVQEPGDYKISFGGSTSQIINIDPNAYEGAADFLLKYMRQQRCFYNPYLQDSCHVDDGYTIYGTMPDSTLVDVTGGWHDATDYLQYLNTSANATVTMLMAWRDYESSFKDEYLGNGDPGSNDVKDVLDEALWGMEWLLKMNPEKDVMFTQIADDRDHAGFRLPNEDSVDYGMGPGKERPVYFVNGEVQGLYKYQNRTEGVSSTAGKFAYAFALAARMGIFEDSVNEVLIQKAIDAYDYGMSKPGFTNTAPCKAPYFYEEENWFDDMGFAAAELSFHDSTYVEKAMSFISEEPIVPWMGADTARHYQWYPFLNLAHFELSQGPVGDVHKETLAGYYNDALRAIQERADRVFNIGVPFIWCSNNLVTAAMTQSLLYRKMTGDDQFIEMETSLRDWLFGVNPWGTVMIVGYPGVGDTPVDPHSSLNFLHGYQTDGGLVDGPVYGNIYNNLKGIRLLEPDEYELFQSDYVVYHDDVGDFSTNEPTMDGTAMLMYYFAYLSSVGLE